MTAEELILLIREPPSTEQDSPEQIREDLDRLFAEHGGMGKVIALLD